MSKNDLFKQLDVSNSVSRNGFNLSNQNRFTAKCGELLPVYHKSVLPGDKFRMSVNSFTRTAPIQTAAFTKFKEYYDWFFVPYRLLGKQIPNILAKNTKNPSIASSSVSNHPIGSKLPYVYLQELYGIDTNGPRYVRLLGQFTNEYGFNRGYLSAKLLNHLGYCFISQSTLSDLVNSGNYKLPYRENLEVTLLPLAAYQKIYYDFYRNTQWEDNVPYNYNFDYIDSNSHFYVDPTPSGGGAINTYYDNPTIFDLRYANYPKDLFMGLLPDSQYGDEAVMEIEANSSNQFAPVITSTDDRSVVVGESYEDGSFEHTIRSNNSNIDLVPGSQLGVKFNSALANLRAGISVLSERKAKALQKYKEILGSGSIDYQTIIRKIFNVDVPDTLSDHCLYLGGSSFVININEVENSNLVESNSAIQRGKGIGSGNGEMIEFESKEYGIVMCIYHVAPIIDYALSAMNFDVVKTSADDYANPVFDNLGFVEFPTYFLTNANIYPNEASLPYDFLGYTSRYFDYKTSIDVTLGDFRETLKDWIAPLDDQYLLQRPNGLVKELDYTFFKINPRIVDTIFGVACNDTVMTDQFRVSATFNVNAVRNLSYLGVPY